MDADLALIFLFILMAASMLFFVALRIQKCAAEHEERKLELKARIAEAKAGSTPSPDNRLEERVRVLERIATDRGVSLADQIDSLRGDSPTLIQQREREMQP